jgi:hypothetical protein
MVGTLTGVLGGLRTPLLLMIVTFHEANALVNTANTPRVVSTRFMMVPPFLLARWRRALHLNKQFACQMALFAQKLVLLAFFCTQNQNRAGIMPALRYGQEDTAVVP